MLGAYVRAIEQLPDKRFLKVVLFGFFGAVVALGLLWGAVLWAFGQVDWSAVPVLGTLAAWLGSFADEIGWLSFLIGAGGLTWILFPVAAVAVISVMLDGICDAVEARHYSDRSPARVQPLLETVFGALKFFAITVALNLAAVPIYLILLVFLGTGAFLFLLVNGYLVGREFFELVAARRMGPVPARRFRKAYSLRIMLFGVLSVFLMSIPFLNLLAPVLAAAAMVHLYESLPRKAEFESMDTAAGTAVSL